MENDRLYAWMTALCIIALLVTITVCVKLNMDHDKFKISSCVKQEKTYNPRAGMCV